MKFRQFILLFILILTSHSIFAIEITSKSVEGYLHGEYNKSFDYFGNTSLIGELELNDLFVFRGGLLIGTIAESVDLKSFASAKASPFMKMEKPKFLVPLDFSLAWNYNGMFAYEKHSNSVYSYATYNWKFVGLSLGYNFRFTSYLGEESMIEGTPLYSFCFKFINNDKHYLGLIWGNFDEFNTRNITEYYYNFFLHVKANDNWTVITNMEFLQTGAIALVETFYGVILKAGVRYTW